MKRLVAYYNNIFFSLLDTFCCNKNDSSWMN